MSTIKGEGGANVVYAFHSQEDGTPQVLRIRKKKQIHETPRDPPLMALEREVWARDFKELKGDLHTLHGDVFYINTIMAPVLGHQYIVPQVPKPYFANLVVLLLCASSCHFVPIVCSMS